ncbi:tetratricopeptide repeat protein [Clostridium puniceum]|uniref:Tetratricopeptide repeat protein n=2 Tax=Clostridium puniceum TaxID=29367 RepID=A0A1S8TV86_9CLOT|nr:tetratricopeptide repeat protein [Clostridium puniceum]
MEDNIIDYISVLFKLGLFDEAYREMIKLNKSYKKYFYLGLYNLEIVKDYTEAKECFESSYKLNDNFIEALNNLGVCYFYLNNKIKAKECFEKAHIRNKEYIDVKNNLENFNVNDFSLKITKRMLRKVLTRYEN